MPILGRRVILTVMPMLVGIATATANPIFVYKDRGSIRFSSKPPPTGVVAEIFTATGKSKFSYYRSTVLKKTVRGSVVLANHYENTIQAISKMNQIDSNLVRSIIHAESGFNARAVSPKGAMGLMQLMPGTSRMLGVRHPFDPFENIDGGTRYLNMLLKRFNGKLSWTIAGYNAGPEAVERYGGIPPYKETRQYVDRVKWLYAHYSARSRGKRN